MLIDTLPLPSASLPRTSSSTPTTAKAVETERGREAERDLRFVGEMRWWDVKRTCQRVEVEEVE
jgi:hypothetical protein